MLKVINLLKLFLEKIFFGAMLLLDFILPVFYSNKIKNIKTVGILLGPYRNLSTLTASILALHPNCQVLNHAGKRVFKNKRTNFFKNYSDKKFNNFLKFAVYASLSGKRGDSGGGIFYSHAFDNQNIRKKYYARYTSHLKKEINCIFWKESLRISNLIKEPNVKIDEIIKKNKKLRFILPVRNPINCAESNLKTGHYKIFNKPIKNVEECIEAIMDEFLFFLKMEDRHPNNFLYFFEDEFISKLPEIAIFLNLKNDQQWRKDTSEIIVARGNYGNDNELKNKSISLAEEYFSNYPGFKEHLIRIIKN